MTDRPGGDSSDEPHELGELPHRELRDAQTLRALAHPVRLRILEELAQRGPATATELADRLGKSAANCSWHLRQLARFGFLEEAPGGTRRERYWRLVLQSQSFGHSDANEEPELALAEDAAAEVMLAREVEALNAWRSARRSEAPEWRAGSTEYQNWTWFTAEELSAFTEDLRAVLERHQSRALARIDPARRPPGCRPVRLVGWAIPVGPETETARESPEPTDP
ncbi:ArsR/SmtB family transcription factor [Actinopolymorpha pittospori]